MTNRAKLETLAAERGARVMVDGCEVELMTNPGRCIDHGSHVAIEEYGAGTSNRTLAAACGALLSLAANVGPCDCDECDIETHGGTV